ncbi:hypothetical protein PT136_04685 (plasmid) [Borreliella garinii]|uniref:hypothetical protein n=1 Tax=Borreliella garinii TaxID=29519 RepID=UPI00292D98B3|nr:hypothetical protein [Borreliella garinii]WNZ72136.1 hypothetical protein PT136_04685 [Borreliella garinii]
MPNYFFTKKDFSNENIYNKGISLQNIFDIHLTGINTNKDKMAIDYTKEELLKNLRILQVYPKKTLKKNMG